MFNGKQKSTFLLRAALIVFFAASIVAPILAPSNTHAETCHTQGGSITEKYFLYTWWCGDNDVTKVYRCNRSGTSFTGCKVITKGHYKHANVIQYEWGSQHFWLFNKGNPQKGASKWCFDLSGNKANSSKCGPIPDNDDDNSNVGKSDLKQGYALYQGYFIKGGSNYNRIFVRKNGKTVKVLEVGHNDEELEDVSVDGDTGEIYFTTSNPSTHLYKASGYKLPAAKNSGSSSSSGSNSKPSSGSSSKSDKTGDSSSSSNGSKSSTGGSAYKAPEHTESTFDGNIETVFFGNIKDDGKGCGVYSVLGLIIDILTFGIGIAAAIGIVISGISILTAGPDSVKSTKAKRRLFEIVIGLAIYAALYAALNFLLPGGKFSSDKKCEETTTSYIHDSTTQ